MPNCELTTLQVMAGYLSWLGLFKVLGATALGAGILFMFGGFIKQVLYSMRIVLELAGYVASAALIAAGLWVDPEYLTWTVFIGCLLFAGCVFATLAIHNIHGDDPKPLAGLFTVVWGAVAVFYGSSEVGFLAVIAFMALVGFTAVVNHLSYAIGFEDERAIPSATLTALLLSAGYVLAKLFMPVIPGYLAVFMPGAFWMGTLVGMTGLLIMTSRYYQSGGGLLLSQIVFLAVAILGLFIGMTFGINPMAGICGVFLVLYLAEKPFEIGPSDAISFGFVLTLFSAIMFGVWWLFKANEAVVLRYLTSSLGG